MLVYLSKKIAIPNETLLSALSWHKTKGFIACGGEDGLLKVLKLEVAQSKDSKLKGLAAPSNLSMNQSLDGHNGCIQVVVWNEEYNRLTSSDQNGLIIVWQLNKGIWVEEMINNRNKSVVRHMKWNRDGSKICIVYDDGAVIVGTVQGGRIWGKELKGLALTHVQWSPDSKVILFGHSKGEVQIYDSHGTYNSKLVVQCLSNVTGLVKLAAVEWYNGSGGSVQPNSPALAVVFDNGCAQLMRHELDANPILLQTHMAVTCVQWNHNGSLLAFGGMQKVQDAKELCSIQFYSAFGQILYTLRVPGRNLCAVSWEGSGLRVAMAVGPHIYFANIRHDYKWGYFSNTVVYAYKKAEKVEDCVVFWNTSTGEKHPKTVRNLLAITSCKDFCLLAAKVEEDGSQCTLLLCNALGTPVDSRQVDMEPAFVSMSHTHIVAASGSCVFVWHYRTSSSNRHSDLSFITGRKDQEDNDKLIHVDDTSVDASTPLTVDFKKAAMPTSDPISCLCSSDRMLVVGRMSGLLQIYSLPKLCIMSQQPIGCKPEQLALNSDSTKISVIDSSGVLWLFDLVRYELGQRLPLERKEVWNLSWSNDNADLFAIMEKTRMYIFRGIDPEEPVVSSGHICKFEDMQVVSVLLDEIMKDPANPTEDLLLNLDIKSLRDTRDLLQKVGLEDAQQFVEDNPHPRLWKLLGESALEKLELDVAEKAFVKSRDYQGINFVKRLKKLNLEPKQKAEVEVYFRRFEEAEKLYLDMDRRDLAVDLRLKLGDWFRVVQLLKSGGGAGDDTLLAQAWNSIGDYYAERQRYRHAVTYYSQGRNYQQLADCYYRLEDFAALKGIVGTLPPNSPHLEDIAKKFISVGMSEEAVEALLKAGMVKEAIDCCVALNQWDLAVQLAKEHSVKEVNSLLAKYAQHLLENEKVLSAIELYRKANHFLNAAKLLIKVAQEGSKQGVAPLKIKKIYVLAAHMIESHVAHNRQQHQSKVTGGGHGSASSSGSRRRGHEMSTTLQELLSEDYSTMLDTSLLSNPWRTVEAYHFFLTVQRLFYAEKFEDSLKTAVFLREYEDVIPPSHLFCLLALTSAACKQFGVCSKAFTKLESMGDCSQERKEAFEKLALQIFTRHPPKDSVEGHMLQCPTCDTVSRQWVSRCTSCDGSFPLCVVTGQPLAAKQVWVCSHCKHTALSAYMQNINNCPLCHSHIS